MKDRIERQLARNLRLKIMSYVF